MQNCNRALWLIALVFSLSTMLLAQGANTALVANVNNYAQFGYTDVWGYTAPDGRHYALQGVNGGVMIVDVSDPANIVEVQYVPFVNGSWYDIKTYRNFMYVTSESSNNVQVVNLGNLPGPVTVANTTGNFGSNPHNNFIDEDMGILYIVEDNNFNRPVTLMSLTFPNSPFELSALGGGLGLDAHDVFAQDSTLYVAEGTRPSIGIFDVRDPINPSLIARLPIPGAGYVHNVWVNADNRYMVTTEETPNKTVKIWDIENLSNISLVSEYLGESQLVHNAMFRGDYIFMSHYESGLKVLDFSDPANPAEVACYDSYPGGDTPNFNGAWGIYPFSESGYIFIGDIQTGLHVLTVDSVRSGGINGIITEQSSGNPVDGVDVHFLEAGKAVASGVDGSYALRTFEGTHTIAFSKPGYFDDTLTVTIPSGPDITQDVMLEANLANISVSVDSISYMLPVDTVFTTELVISNSGPSGRLDYVLDDVNGPIGDGSVSGGPRRLINSGFGFSGMAFSTSNPVAAPDIESLVGDTLIVDPAGDEVFGQGGDVIGVYTTVTATQLIFDIEFFLPVVTDSAAAVIGLDIDFDVSTGAFPGGFGFLSPAQAVGSEFDLLVDIGGQIIGTPNIAYLFTGSNSPGGAPPIGTSTITIDGHLASFAINLADIGGQANAAVAGLSALAYQGNALSLDLLPDVGNAALGTNPNGDVPWVMLSDSSGTLGGGESDTIIVTLDTHGLSPGENLNGVIAIFSNDPDQPLVGVAVNLQTTPVVGIGQNGELAGSFRLLQNYPNPFNPSTQITFELPFRDVASLKIFNVLGQEVATLVSGRLEAGVHNLAWDGKNRFGQAVASGIYFYQLQSGSFSETRRMLLMR